MCCHEKTQKRGIEILSGFGYLESVALLVFVAKLSRADLWRKRLGDNSHVVTERGASREMRVCIADRGPDA